MLELLMKCITRHQTEVLSSLTDKILIVCFPSITFCNYNTVCQACNIMSWRIFNSDLSVWPWSLNTPVNQISITKAFIDWLWFICSLPSLKFTYLLSHVIDFQLISNTRNYMVLLNDKEGPKIGSYKLVLIICFERICWLWTVRLNFSQQLLGGAIKWKHLKSLIFIKFGSRTNNAIVLLEGFIRLCGLRQDNVILLKSKQMKKPYIIFW